MRVLVCGGRDYHNRSHVNAVLSEIKPTVIIEGGAKGADFLAADWARSNIEEEIGSISGHESKEMIRKYAGDARQIMLAKSANKKREA